MTLCKFDIHCVSWYIFWSFWTRYKISNVELIAIFIEHTTMLGTNFISFNLFRPVNLIRFNCSSTYIFQLILNSCIEIPSTIAVK